MSKTRDGSDFKHRQKILPQYQLAALCKKRLQFVIYLHLLLGVLMAFKLLPSFLDALNIFWQPIEELYIPLARRWEVLWFSSILILGPGLNAIKKSNTFKLKLFLLGIFVTCLSSITYCAYEYLGDFKTYVITRDTSLISDVWRGYPVALYWYIFIVVAAQVHGFELYFGWELLRSLSNHRSHNKNK